MILPPDYRAPTLAERIAANTEATRRPLRAAERQLDAARERHEAATLRRDGGALAHARSSDAELRELAKLRAELLDKLLQELAAPMTPAGLLEWLNGHLERLQGGQFRFQGEAPEGEQLRGVVERVRCARWWRRQLRRAAVRLRETEANTAGEVNARTRQPYVTHDTAHRHQRRAAATAAMMAATELENEAGQVMTLADLSARTVANKAIRRGELMTRISGCERLAEHAGQRGVFLTLTAPSRYHRMLRAGGQNPRWEAGATPRAAHEWLCATWAKARAALARRGIVTFGFRVAEPHHDGCPHWHALLWAAPGQLWRLLRVIKRAWLKAVDPRPYSVIHRIGCKRYSKGAEVGIFRDVGAREHRVKAVLMRPGHASGYVAKYIAKNIDDAGAVGVEGHRDDGLPGVPDVPQSDLFGGTAARVEAWASAWGIRQFQAIGQPPVTVWRELRRVPDAAQAGATPRLRVAFDAVNRAGERRADWAAYVLAQGGLGRGRRYLLRIATLQQLKHGRYESRDVARPVGVFDAAGPGDWHLSNRSEWKERGQWREQDRARSRGPFAPRAVVPPWTRVNNCTRRGAADLMRSGIVGVRMAELRNRGGTDEADEAGRDDLARGSGRAGRAPAHEAGPIRGHAGPAGTAAAWPADLGGRHNGSGARAAGQAR